MNKNGSQASLPYRTKVLGQDSHAKVVTLETTEGDVDYAILLENELQDSFHIHVPTCPPGRCSIRHIQVAVPVSDLPPSGQPINCDRAVALEKLTNGDQVIITDETILEAISSILDTFINQR